MFKPNSIFEDFCYVFQIIFWASMPLFYVGTAPHFHPPPPPPPHPPFQPQQSSRHKSNISKSLTNIVCPMWPHPTAKQIVSKITVQPPLRDNQMGAPICRDCRHVRIARSSADTTRTTGLAIVNQLYQ